MIDASEPFDEPAGPPRFLKCMRDIWAPLGEDVEFEVEVSGYPLPELTWYHLDEKILEEKNVQVLFLLNYPKLKLLIRLLFEFIDYSIVFY